MKVTEAKAIAYIMANALFKDTHTTATELSNFLEIEVTFLFSWFDFMAQREVLEVFYLEFEDTYVLPTENFKNRYINDIVKVVINERLS